MASVSPSASCGMITPWNFHGHSFVENYARVDQRNTVVSSRRRYAGYLPTTLWQILTEAGVPEALLSRQRNGPNAGAPLAEHLDVPVISFTGSTAVGRRSPKPAHPNSNIAASNGRQEHHHRDGRPPTSTSPSTAPSGAVRHHRSALQPRKPDRRSKSCTANSLAPVARAKKLKVGNGLDQESIWVRALTSQQLKTVME